MKYSEIMIRYGELSTKGRNRKFFIKKLRDQVVKALKDIKGPKVEYNHDRMYVYLNGADGEEVMERIRHIFGIQSLSPVLAVEKDLDTIKEAAVDLVKKEYEPGKTFKISTKRSDHSFAYDTNDINQEAGAAVVEALPEIQAQMKHPDITCRIEIRQDAAYLMTGKVEGPGGLPVGSSGRGMLMLSGGIDSPVAGYLAQRKGLDIEAVHFHSPPYTSPQALQKAKDLTAKLARHNGSVNFISVPFTEIQETIKNEVPDEYSMTLNRRFMMRITDRIRADRSGLAIINGESIGQVASQTLESMAVINEVTTTPVLRPVVAMTKDEIIQIAKDIDTYELAIQPYEDCCTVFAPVKPKTKPKMAKVLEFESRLDVQGLIDRALANIEIEEITADVLSEKQEEDFFEALL